MKIQQFLMLKHESLRRDKDSFLNRLTDQISSWLEILT